jgi:cell division protein FtsW
MRTERTADPWLLAIVVGLTAGGFFIFSSASLGFFAREETALGTVIWTRVIAGLIGILLAYGVSVLHYRVLRRYALALFLCAATLTALVFVPGLGLEHGGAKRWISILGFSFQPSEALKIASVIYGAALFASAGERIKTLAHGLAPFAALLIIPGLLLLLQPDTDTFVVLSVALFAMFLGAGGRMRHIGIVALVLLIGLGVLIWTKPYLAARVATFLNPAADPQGAGYQIQQSLIAIGSGGALGRGFGQSVQKFSYLPEPIGDSIFAVAAEEFGFIGGAALVLLFLFLILRGLRLTARAPDPFSGLLALGIVILIGASAFTNIASMLGVIPLSGLPLAFVSHGGTALVIALVEAGILLNISRYQRQ